MNEIDEAAIRKQAVERVRLKREFTTHLTLYVVVTACLFLIWLLTSGGYPWFVWPLFGWGIGIVAHAVTLGQKLRETGGDDRAVEREIRRLRDRVPP